MFNSSANNNGHVLNDYLAKGPQMLNNLLGVFLRFREEQFAIVGDIKKMFHSIRTTLHDQMLHLFFWRFLDETIEPKVFAITAVNFGDRPSSAIAIAALRKTANMGVNISETASQVIKDNSYMDDVLDSVTQASEAHTMMNNIDKILEKGSFQIKEWITNAPQPAKTCEIKGNEKTITSANEKVLGMEWFIKEDKIKFKIKLIIPQNTLASYSESQPVPIILNKRIIVGIVNGVFDPIGLLSAFLAKAKILLRKLWGQDKKLEWNETFADALTWEWICFLKELYEVEKISFRRCVKPPNNVGNPQLVIFSDGSGNLYGAAAYVRWELTDGTFVSYLLVAKTRVAPLKVIDIVRLELCGVLIGKRLRKFILKEMRYTFSKIYHIMDSEIVKAMISKESYGFNTFAANRIGEIQQDTKEEEFYWLPGKLNVADYVTRGKSPEELDSESLWQCGPEFLRLPEVDWPISNKYECNTEDLPERTKQVFEIEINEEASFPDIMNIQRFRSFQLLINTTARLIRLQLRFKHGKERKEIEIKPQDVQSAEKLWIIEAQKQLKIEVQAGKHKKLCPQEQDGILVVGGRTERWMGATWNRQKFILMPKKHYFSKLIAIQKHKENGHLAVSATVAQIRSKYWIIGVRRIVNSIVESCTDCKAKREQLHGQIMANLPIERLKPAPPFASVGCDYFGPFTIKGEVQKRVRGKCYGVILTCLVSRAVYIDISHDYSTDAFLQVLRRFACMRGWPNFIYSDRGSQLVSASKELKQVVNDIDFDQVRKLGLKHNMEWTWKFSSPDAPWMNGATEALVKTAKKVLDSAIGENILSFSEIQTAMFECGQLINQRPIGQNPSSPDDGSYICPNDLLLGRASPEIPQGPFQKRNSNKHRLDFIQGIVASFWKKWIRDCFPNLVIQPKWHTERRNLEKGDVVLIGDENAIRGKWRKGIITKPIPSEDGRVRRVVVAYKNFPTKEQVNQYKGSQYTEVERAVHRLIVLVPASHADEQ